MGRATIAQVARAARVSSTAISLYLHNRPGLSDTTRERIARAIRKVGYVPRERRNDSTSKLIALLVEELPDPIFSETYSELVQELERHAHQGGYHVVLKPVGQQANGRIEHLVAGGQMAGLIALGGGDLTDEILATLATLSTPLVLVDNYLIESPTHAVVPDNELGAYLVTRHLIDRGHRDVGIIMGPSKYKPLVDRLQGYLRAMVEFGLLKTDLMQPPLSHALPNKGYLEMQALLARPHQPTAVFCVSDRAAFGALTALREAGLRVPRDMALAGFDNVSASGHSDPPLTTAHMPKREMGALAASRVLELIEHPQDKLPPLKLVLPTSLIVRGTT